MKLHIIGNPDQKAIEDFMGEKADLGNFSYYFLAFSKNNNLEKTGVGVKISRKASIEEAIKLIGDGVNKLLNEENKKGRFSKIIGGIME